MTAQLINDAQVVPSANYTLTGELTYGKCTITVTYSGKTTTFTCLVYDEIASGYGKLHYIQSTKSQSLNTGIKAPVIKYMALDMEFTELRTDTDWYAAVGTAGSGWNINLRTTSSNFTWRWGYNSAKSFTGDTNRHTFTITVPATYSAVGDTATVTCDEETGTVQKGSASTFLNWNIVLFANGNNAEGTAANHYAAMKLYSCIMKDVNGNNLFNAVPVIRMSDKIAGLYDYVTNTFIASAGTLSYA